ncbi:unnamed protein product [Prorocentrum cordatum]|uniref:FACT complex subunit n=1 Tax=Prorocentrum cordatum TaxID=2364126 RepID=A0ABN9X3K7_9DINO|nr:unnamed protein product [Polarella glacialis]
MPMGDRCEHQVKLPVKQQVRFELPVVDIIEFTIDEGHHAKKRSKPMQKPYHLVMRRLQSEVRFKTGETEPNFKGRLKLITRLQRKRIPLPSSSSCLEAR